MEEKLVEDLKRALKENNAVEKSTIQLIRAQILKARKDKQASLTEAEIKNIIVKERKKWHEALAMYY